MKYDLQYSRYSDNSILINWPQEIHKDILFDILSFKKFIKISLFKLNIEVINTYASILVIYDCTIDDFNSVKYRLEELYFSFESSSLVTSKLWRIPVCYDKEYGTDLEDVSTLKKMKVSEIIRRHTSALYQVYFLGFLPGFPYLGGLDYKLHLPRKKQPALHAEKGSVAIGASQTGIYPQSSPGGWYVIGRTPIELFNAKNVPPIKIQAGDSVEFYSIDTKEFDKIQSLVDTSDYELKPEQL